MRGVAVPGQFWVEPSTVLGAVPQWDSAADAAGRGARAASTCVSLGSAALTGALSEFQATWSEIGARITETAQAIGPALTTTATNYVDTDDGAATALTSLTSSVGLRGPR